MAGRNDDQIRCSFCNKTQSQVRKLIAGPGGVYICDECIDVCAEIMEEEFEYENTRNINPFDDINLLKPEEIKAFLDEYVIGQEEAKKVAERLGNEGRILLRQSGTEPLVRVMVEAKDLETCQSCVDQVVKVIEERGHLL
mgnify:CR=1 FL=1